MQTPGFPDRPPQFLKRNQNQTPEESIEALEAAGTLAYNAGLDFVAYLSMAFGNPYGDTWSIDEVADACDLLIESGVRQISLADTVGLATPADWQTINGVAPSTKKLRSAFICTPGRNRPQNEFVQRTSQDADDLTRRSAASEDAPLRRMSSWGIFRLRL